MFARLKTNGRTNMTKVAPLTKRRPILTFVRLLGALLLVAMALHSAPAFADDVYTNADLDGAYVYSVGRTALATLPSRLTDRWISGAKSLWMEGDTLWEQSMVASPGTFNLTDLHHWNVFDR